MSKITINTRSPRFPIADRLYGLFFEDINRSGDSGIYPELIRNRSFEDGLTPENCSLIEDGRSFVTKTGWVAPFNNGEGLPDWINNARIPYTPVPGWYARGAEISIDTEDTLNPHRKASLRVAFHRNGHIVNVGYMGIPVYQGKALDFYMFAKANKDTVIRVSIVNTDGDRVYAETDLRIDVNGYVKYDAILVPTYADTNANICIEADDGVELRIGFISLMPTDTYKGHGLRRDLIEMLEDLHPGFMRFPGGCIVEGYNQASALRFADMVGPVWERPSYWSLWAYRSTNGFGFHEWLQLCEDLNMKAMWVCNCGMTCQSRKPYFCTDAEIEDWIQDALDAIDYATAPVGTHWGDLRAEMGHAAPFRIDYIEIGNENFGEAYTERYKRFYDVIKQKHPEIELISNIHTERYGLPTEIVDEHYYSTASYFVEHTGAFDEYDRRGPKVFIGEYAVMLGKPATWEAALSEAAYLLGVEHNQDVVRLVSYAPLFENVNYRHWHPNLIAFDNSGRFGIPSYHMLKLLGSQRGGDVLPCACDTPMISARETGCFGLQMVSGVRFKEPKVDGVPAPWREVTGTCTEGEYSTAVEKADDPALDAVRVIYGEVDKPVALVIGDDNARTFEVDVRGGNAACADVTLKNRDLLPGKLNVRFGAMDFRFPAFRWTLQNGVSSVCDCQDLTAQRKLASDVRIPWQEKWYRLRVEMNDDSFDCYIDNVQIHHASFFKFPSVVAAADADDESVRVKFVNLNDHEEMIEIELDREVQSVYTAYVLDGDPNDTNTMAEHQKIMARDCEMTGASRSFVYHAKPHSLNVLRIKKA